MSTWWWVLVWVFLVLAALAYLAARAWGLWGHVRELTRELAVAQERVEGVQGQLERLGGATSEPPELAVFSSPETLRSARLSATRNPPRRRSPVRSRVRDVH